MPRPRRDGTPTQALNKHRLSDLLVRKLKPKAHPFMIWDSYQRGLAVVVQPTGHKSWKCIYSLSGRPRWYHIGNVAAIDLSDARKLASRVMFAVAEGRDPQAEKKAERGKDTFMELAHRYVEEYAKRKNKSWRQGEGLVRKNLLPHWGKLQGRAMGRKVFLDASKPAADSLVTGGGQLSLGEQPASVSGQCCR